MNIPDDVASPKHDGARRQLLVLALPISTGSPIQAVDDAKAVYGESKGPAFNTRSKGKVF